MGISVHAMQLWLLLQTLATSGATELRGLPFNLPESKYCTSCEMDSSKFYYPTMILDEACLGYLIDLKSPHKTVEGTMFKLLEDLISIHSPASYIVHAYIESMRAYQSVWDEPYDFSVMGVPTLQDSVCIKLLKSGQGFSRPVPQSAVEPDKFIFYLTGKSWEARFLTGIEDIWVSSVCNVKNHQKQYLKSLERMNSTWQISKSWEIHQYVPRRHRFDPIINMEFFRPCGDNSSIPPSISDNIQKCGGRMECDVPLSQPGRSRGQGTSRMEQLQRPAQKPFASLPGPAVEEPSAKKSKTEEQQQSFIISEFNPSKNGFWKPYKTLEEFIEIRVHPPPGKKKQTFRSLKVICVGAISEKLLMVANLQKVDIPENGYFAIRSTALEGSNYVHISADPDRSFKLLPCYDKEPIVIMLLERSKETRVDNWEKLKLKPQRDGRELSKDLSEESGIWDVIRETIIDAQLYGILRNSEIAPHIQSVLPFTGCNFIIPIGDVDSVLEMTSSLNYCKEDPYVDPFQYNFFKLGAFSIGLPNDCSRDVEYQTDRTKHVQRNDVDTVGVTSTPSSEAECPAKNNLIGVLQTQINAEIGIIKYKFNAAYTTNLYPTKTFGDTVWKEISSQESIRLDEIKDLHPYELVYHDPGDGRAPSRLLRCKVCHQRLHECPDSLTHSQKGSKITFGDEIPTLFSLLRRKMFDHLDSQQHLTSVLYFIQKERIQLAADAGKRMMVGKDPEIQQLANVIDITFTFLHTNTAPFNAKSWYETLTKIHANVGNSLHSKDTAYKIVDFIAQEGTENILRYIVEKDLPFTLILDGSADSRNHHYVIVYLQALEGDVTIPYFAFFLKLGTSFTAESYLKALKEEVDRQESKVAGFKNYFMSRIVAVATDSANVMALFHAKLNEWIARKGWNDERVNIVSIYCLAHKLQLSSRNSIVPLKTDSDVPYDSPLYYFSYLEKFMQSSYVWFKWSGKHIGVFRELIIEEGLPKVEFKELHAERWISSEYATVKNFVTAWKTARLALQKMLDENQKENKIRKEISSYDDQFRDKTALITIHFLWDFTATFKVWSEFLQKMSGLLIDQFKYFEHLKTHLAEMKGFAGPVLTEFLNNCICQKKGCTLTEYEDAAEVECYKMKFTNTNPQAPKFSDAATALLEKVQQQLNKYIPWELLSNAYTLHPSQLPASIEALNMQFPPGHLPDYPDRELRVYAGVQVTKLAQMLGIDPNGFLQEWQELVESIVSLDVWKELRINRDTNVFWALALNKEGLKWTDRTAYFIRALKTISPGSVACETGFSIFNNIKTKNRMGTSDSHVESIMKILINGPKTVNEFDSNYYATYWLLRGNQKPKPEIPQQEKMCTSVPEEAFEILDDVERNTEQGLEWFPFDMEATKYNDVYEKMRRQPDFLASTKEKRTKSRARSKIF